MMEIVLTVVAVVLAVALAVVWKRCADARAAGAALDVRLSETLGSLSACREELESHRRQLAASRESESAVKAQNQGLTSRYDELNSVYSETCARLAEAREALSVAREENSALTTRMELLEKRFAEMQSAAEERFKNIATEILEHNSRTFKQQNEERLGEILSPLNDQIQAFKKRVEDIYNEESREFFSLKERLKDLRDIGEMMGREAKELTGALRGNTGVQGQWGEMVLETILEQSGLRRGFEYEVQVTRDASGAVLTDDEGNTMRPDVVVRYPDGRCVVIDSKSSMTAYMDYVAATDERQRKSAGQDHVASVRRHMEKLSSKRYEDLLGDASLDFVMMFIPSEAAYVAAMRLDPGLWLQAYNKRVLIVSPSHLVSALKIIEHLWRRERQTANVVKIADEAGKMYDKFAAFVADLQKIGRNLATTRNSFDDAMKKLTTGTGNLVGRAEKLRELGVKASKSLPKGLLEEIDAEDAEGNATENLISE